jgi:hypothetical protein
MQRRHGCRVRGTFSRALAAAVVLCTQVIKEARNRLAGQYGPKAVAFEFAQVGGTSTACHCSMLYCLHVGYWTA